MTINWRNHFTIFNLRPDQKDQIHASFGNLQQTACAEDLSFPDALSPLILHPITFTEDLPLHFNGLSSRTSFFESTLHLEHTCRKLDGYYLKNICKVATCELYNMSIHESAEQVFTCDFGTNWMPLGTGIFDFSKRFPNALIQFASIGQIYDLLSISILRDGVAITASFAKSNVMMKWLGEHYPSIDGRLENPVDADLVYDDELYTFLGRFEKDAMQWILEPVTDYLMVQMKCPTLQLDPIEFMVGHQIILLASDQWFPNVSSTLSK